MGFFDKIKRIFERSGKEEAIQQRLKAIESDSTAIESDLKRSNKRFKAIQSDSNFAIDDKKDDIKPKEYYTNENLSGFTKLSQKSEDKRLSEPVELQKESLQLGVAAGYTGRAIKEIESSLNRIESGMASKEWLLSNFGDQTKLTKLLIEIKEILEKHDANALKRFEAIQIALNRLSSAAEGAPEPLKQQLLAEIDTIEANLPLTPKMESLVSVVKERGRMSYNDLASKLGITRSSLRGLLSNTIKRTKEIERFSIEGKGWVRYKYPKTTQLEEFQ